MMKHVKILITLSFIWSCLPFITVYAQSPEVVPVTGQVAVKTEELNARFTGSLFLSAIELAVIQQALSGKVPNTETLKAEDAAIPVNRLIAVSGVLYRGPGDWIVWMNGQKVTPKKLLPEIVDIHVENSSHVSLKWYDVARKAVISVTMRPRQTYDITTGLIWPGEN